MLKKGFWFVLACIAIGIVQGCTTACEGRLCAPIIANTSAAPMPAPPTPPAPDPAIVRIALLLPLRSDALGAAADAVRAGFMAAYERERAGFQVTVIATGDSAQDALDAYAQAVAKHDIVVGPLTRTAVAAVAASPLQGKPTIALNSAGGADIALPERMLAMGLSIEDEARQVANWASSEHDKPQAMIIGTASAWQQRIAGAFAAQWKQLGLEAETVELGATNGYLQEASLAQLKARVDSAPPTLLFAALDADQLRQVRGMLGPALPVYGTSSVNPGTESGSTTTELDGLRLLDLPWQVQADHPAVMAYPRLPVSRSLDIDRLYALGIDAFRVAHDIAAGPGPQYLVDGVTGRLAIRFGEGASHFERAESMAIFQSGRFTPPKK
jgi:outer membrane PBP1 activator LpoA protein